MTVVWFIGRTWKIGANIVVFTHSTRQGEILSGRVPPWLKNYRPAFEAAIEAANDTRFILDLEAAREAVRSGAMVPYPIQKKRTLRTLWRKLGNSLKETSCTRY